MGELLSCDFNHCLLLAFNEGSDEDLILGRDHLMQSEKIFAYETMQLEIVKLIKVVNVIHDNFELLLLLELVWHVEALYPVGVQAVHDNLRHAQLLPHGAPLLVEHRHAVSASEGVEVWQIFASERQPKSLDQTLLSVDYV